MDAQENGGIGLKYVLVKGNKDNLRNKANVSKNTGGLVDARLSPHSIRSK